MNPNILLGSFLIFVATISIVLAFLIAIRQYLFPPHPQGQVALPPEELIKLFLQLLDDILKAPPALAFLVTGILIGSVGIWLLIAKPL